VASISNQCLSCRTDLALGIDLGIQTMTGRPSSDIQHDMQRFPFDALRGPGSIAQFSGA
jgi:hypothetical protein